MHLTHLEHIEDNLMQYHETVISMLNDIHESNNSNVNISLKYDGSPSIIFGIDPFTNKFFLSTKSLFNKNPKINYNSVDIMKNHGTNYTLATKLMYVFSVLAPVYQGGIVQADLLFTENELIRTHDNSVEFTPNTLTYKPHAHDMDTFYKIVNAKIGLVIHTQYLFNRHDSTTLQDMSAYPISRPFDFGPDVFVCSVKVHVNARINEGLVKLQETYIQQYKDFDDVFVTDKILTTGLYDDYKIFYNSCIRDNDLETSADHFSTHYKKFIDFLIDRHGKKLKSLKTASAMKNHLYVLDSLMHLVHDEKVKLHFQKMIEVRDVIDEYKNNFLTAMQTSGTLLAKYNDVVCNHEGYVLSSPSYGMMKIVNRREFSMHNFNKNGNSFTK